MLSKCSIRIFLAEYGKFTPGTLHSEAKKATINHFWYRFKERWGGVTNSTSLTATNQNFKRMRNPVAF